MRTKLKLDLDKLQVESFDSQSEQMEQRGTVIGQWSLGCDTMYDGTCHGYGTCGIYPCRPIP
jgi:hypothetical protein